MSTVLPINNAHARANSVIELSLRDHNIGMVIPAGDVVDGGTMRLSGGILILGALRGKVTCANGSAIVAAGGEFQGDLDALSVYVEGKITSNNIKSLSRVRALGMSPGGILVLSEKSNVSAVFSARATQICNGALTNSSMFLTLQQANAS